MKHEPERRKIMRQIVTTHWGELVQGPYAHSGAVKTALLTLPRMDLRVTAQFIPNKNLTGIVVMPRRKKKSQEAVNRLLNNGQQRRCPGQIHLSGDMPEEVGAGSSTGDIYAVITLLNTMFELGLSKEAVQWMIWDIEKASDPIGLLDETTSVLYGSRCGDVFRDDLPSLPSHARCVAFQSSARKVRTDSLLGTTYTTQETDRFGMILDMAIRGLQTSDLTLIGRAATASAILNQRVIAFPNFRQLLAVADSCAGISISHSGTVGSFIISEHDFSEHWFNSVVATLSPFGFCGFSVF